MDWIDFLLQIDNNVRLETKVDLNDPLPWKIDLSNSVDRTPCATTSHAYWQPHQQTDSQPITIHSFLVCGPHFDSLSPNTSLGFATKGRLDCHRR